MNNANVTTLKILNCLAPTKLIAPPAGYFYLNVYAKPPSAVRKAEVRRTRSRRPVEAQMLSF